MYEKYFPSTQGNNSGTSDASLEHTSSSQRDSSARNNIGRRRGDRHRRHRHPRNVDNTPQIPLDGKYKRGTQRLILTEMDQDGGITVKSDVQTFSGRKQLMSLFEDVITYEEGKAQISDIPAFKSILKDLHESKAVLSDALSSLGDVPEKMQIVLEKFEQEHEARERAEAEEKAKAEAENAKQFEDLFEL